MARLTVKGLEFFAYHGCHIHEQKTGGKFRVDIHIDDDFNQAASTDKLEHAIDYVQVMNIAERQMKVRCDLIETVAKNIAVELGNCLSKPNRIEVIVYKLKVPLKHKLSHVSVNFVIENNQ